MALHNSKKKQIFESVYLRPEIDNYFQLISLPSEYKRRHDYPGHHTHD